MFINRNAVHLTTGQESCHYHSFIIPARLFAASPEIGFHEKYIKSITEYNPLTYMAIKKEELQHRPVLASLEKLDEICFNRKTDDLWEYRKAISIMELWLEFLRIVPKGYSDRPKKDYTRIQTMLSYIHAHYQEPLSVEALSEKSIISKTECQRCFKKYIGQSPYQYVQNYRLLMGAKLLENTRLNVTEISGQVGYASCSSFIQHFRRKYGYTPQDYRNKNEKNKA